MSNIQCFKSKAGTNYDSAIKKHFSLLPKWNEMFSKVSELLGENITQLAYSLDYFIIDPSELTKEENKKLFKADGQIKSNTKQAKELFAQYKEIIKEVGLYEYEELSRINFAYGVMRTRGQELESFRTSENDIYYKADFDLEKRSSGNVEPITEIEYEEKYLEELKKSKAKEDDRNE